MSTELEQKIMSALTETMSSADLQALTLETNDAITQAENDALLARERAFDPLATPDPQSARQKMEDAAFKHGRFLTLVPRLQARYQEVLAAEAHARWEADYESVNAQVQQAAHKWTKYRKLAAQMVETVDTEAIDAEVSRVNGSAPDGEHRRLRGVELTARGLDAFSVENPSIAKALQLPDFEHSRHMAWPRPEVPLGVRMALSMSVPPHPGDDWASTAAQDNVRRAENERRWADEEAARQAESKRRYEDTLPR